MKIDIQKLSQSIVIPVIKEFFEGSKESFLDSYNRLDDTNKALLMLICLSICEDSNMIKSYFIPELKEDLISVKGWNRGEKKGPKEESDAMWKTCNQVIDILPKTYK